MEKFICLNNKCGAIFDEDEIVSAVIDRHPFGEGTAPEYGCICPRCKCAEIALAVRCESCGRYVPEDQSTYYMKTEKIICDRCFQNASALHRYLRKAARPNN